MRELVAATEAGLNALGLQYAKSDAKELVEFDVPRPGHFMVRITHLAEREYPSAVLGLGYSSRQRESTDFRIYFPDGSAATRTSSSGLVKHILSSLKRPPWKGLGYIESGTSKALWQRAAEGRE